MIKHQLFRIVPIVLAYVAANLVWDWSNQNFFAVTTVLGAMSVPALTVAGRRRMGLFQWLIALFVLSPFVSGLVLLAIRPSLVEWLVGVGLQSILAMLLLAGNWFVNPFTQFSFWPALLYQFGELHQMVRGEKVDTAQKQRVRARPTAAVKSMPTLNPSSPRMTVAHRAGWRNHSKTGLRKRY